MVEYVMYVVVNSDLKMGKGKIAAQVAHSACKSSHLAEKYFKPAWKSWWQGSYTKIVLKASGYEMSELIRKYKDMCMWTYDEGRTQVDKGSLTTLAFVPMIKDDIPFEISELKLL